MNKFCKNKYLLLAMVFLAIVVSTVTVYFSYKNSIKSDNFVNAVNSKVLSSDNISDNLLTNSELADAEQKIEDALHSPEAEIKPSTGNVATDDEYKYDEEEDPETNRPNRPEENVSSNVSSNNNSSTESSSQNVSSSNSSDNDSSSVIIESSSEISSSVSSNISSANNSSETLTSNENYTDDTSSLVTSSNSSSNDSSNNSSSDIVDSKVPIFTTNDDNTWIKRDGKTYFYSKNNPVKGFADIDGFRYYFDIETGEKKSQVGIDVSKYQGEINWTEVKNSGIDFVFIRVGFRGYGTGKLSIDPYFVRNIEGATAAGIKCGVYFYSVALTEIEGAQEANFVLNAIKEYKVELPIVIDVEHEWDRVKKLTVKQRTNNTLAFIKAIESENKKPMLYTGYYFYKERLDSNRLKDYKLWIAYYTDYANKLSDVKYTYWQYTDEGKVNGIKGFVDMNVLILK